MIIKHWITPTSGIRVRFIGTVDFKQLYKIMKLWLEDKGYATAEKLEKHYIERVKPEGKQIEMVWECGRKLSDYYQYKIRITFLNVKVSDVEVQKENYKIKLLKGDYDIRIMAWIEEGSEEWDKLGPFRRIFQKFIARSRFEGYRRDLHEKMIELQTHIKKFLELRT